MNRRTIGAVAATLLLLCAGIPLISEAAPPVTSAQAAAAIAALQAGAPIPPDVAKALEERPDLVQQLPPEVREKLKARMEAEAKAKPEPEKPATAPAEAPPSLPPYDWRTSVYVGNLFSERLREAERKALTHFGHEIFVPRRGGASVMENVPVAPDYIVGPGDEVIVRLWGRMEGTHRMVVDRDGKIFFPKIGSLSVAGKKFSELQSFIRSKVSNIAEVRSEVSLGEMKGIRISVMGEVRAPGWYNVSSVHTAVQALYLAGGVKDIGSLRRIELVRGGKAAGRLDLYDFLLRGETGADLRLLQGDTIFVPVVGNLVAVAGEVRRPAIYELDGEKTIQDVIRMAGGFSPTAYKRRVQVERLERHLARIVMDADVEELEKAGGQFALSDGDIVRVLPIVHEDVNVVTLEGNVARPGRYELKPGMTAGTLLPDIESFLPDTYFDYALLARLVPPDFHKEVVPVNLRAIVLEKKKEADVALMPRDTLRVFHRSAFRDRPRATISGEVRMIPPGPAARKRFGVEEGGRPAPADNTSVTFGIVPGEPPAKKRSGVEEGGRPTPTDNAFLAFGIPPARPAAEARIGRDEERPMATADNVSLTFEIHPGARVSDLVKMAGGVTRSASLGRAEIVRVDEARNFRTVYFDLGKALAGDESENPLLQDEDRVRIHSIWETKYRMTASIDGEVNAPGDFVLTEGMRLSDLIFKAGGLTEGAYAREAELVRREVAPGGEFVRTETLRVSPERALAGDKDADVVLKEHDLVLVRQIPEWGEKVWVTVAGEVRFPGEYAVRKGEPLSSLIVRAGGFTPDAYLKAAQFTRVSTRKEQQAAIDRLIEELEIEVAQRAQAVAGALEKEDVEASKQLLAARQSLVAQLRKARAKGRVIIHLAAAEKLKGTSADILLEEGDRLEVSKTTNVVNVVGRVYNPTGVVYDPARDTVEHYLKTVGGPTESADSDHIFLVRADGSVVTEESAGGGFFLFGGGLMSAKVEPGDSIVVPEKLEEPRTIKNVKDVTQIIFQIAVTAGILIAAF